MSKGGRLLLDPAALAADMAGNGNTSTGRRSSFSKLIYSLQAGTDLRSVRGRSATPSDRCNHWRRPSTTHKGGSDLWSVGDMCAYLVFLLIHSLISVYLTIQCIKQASLSISKTTKLPVLFLCCYSISHLFMVPEVSVGAEAKLKESKTNTGFLPLYAGWELNFDCLPAHFSC